MDRDKICTGKPQKQLRVADWRKSNTSRSSLEAFPIAFLVPLLRVGGRGGNLTQLNLKIEDNWQ